MNMKTMQGSIRPLSAAAPMASAGLYAPVSYHPLSLYLYTELKGEGTYVIAANIP
jgi:hypothetical protein